MLKKILLLTLTFTALSSQAEMIDSLCQLKQINSAKMALAQSIPTDVANVELLNIEPGVWTPVPENSSGYDFFTVRAPNHPTRDLVIMKYLVEAKQIGSTADCEILGVYPAPN